MFERKFTTDDQNIFAKLSGDYNKLHMDENVAHRYMFGGLVVHGMHMVLWALDKFIESSEKSLELISLRAIFKKNLHVGDSVGYRVIGEKDLCIELELYGEEGVYAVIKVEYKTSNAKIADKLNFKFPEYGNCNVLSAEEVMDASGELELCIEKNTAGYLFPNIVNKLSLTQVAEVLATTRLVGMECPGFHSIFSELNVNFNKIKSDSNVLRYRVMSFDSRFSLLVMAIEGSYIKGSIKAFLRPPAVRQSSFSDLLKIVTPDEFKNQNALIIGGSRGLGEVVSKLLTAGGARIILTYNKGYEDARRVMDEIIKGGGNAGMMRFNVLASGEAEVDELIRLSPTHIYYFATPYIVTNKGAFSVKLFKEFCNYYIFGFTDTLDFLFKHIPSFRKVFYPSSVFVEEQPSSLAEYAAAKAAGETICSLLEKNKKNILFYRPRLPKMTTDQTISIISDNRNDPAPIMLNQLRYFRNYIN